MTVVASHLRRTDLYGNPVREKWRAEYDAQLEVSVRVLPPEGSKALFVLNEVPLGDVPDDVLDELEGQMDEAAGQVP